MVAAELTGADSGLGWRIFWYQEFFAMDKVLAVILTIGVLGYSASLLRWLQRRVTRWRPDVGAGSMTRRTAPLPAASGFAATDPVVLSRLGGRSSLGHLHCLIRPAWSKRRSARSVTVR